MPETSLHEDNFAVPGQNDVWPARQVRPVEDEAKSEGMQDRPNRALGHSVFASNARH